MDNGQTRRSFLRRIGLGTLGLGFGVSVSNGIYEVAEGATQDDQHRLLMKGSVNFMGFRAKEITPNDEFYITAYSDLVPAVDPAAFRLRIEGLVAKPLSLTLKDLQAMKDTTEFVTFECIGNPVGGDAIGNALWDGVGLKRLIEQAGPGKGVTKVACYAEDGYSDSIPYALATSGDVFLAFAMNGDPLPAKHGFPVRLVVPGIYGMKSVKWISKIELVNYDFQGYWEKRGWSDSAVISLMSEVLMPMTGKTIPAGNYVIGGVAFGGRFGVGKVQVSLDDGSSWKDAELKAPLSAWAWTLWRFDWNPSREGSYTLKVRALDRAGKIQESPSLIGELFSSSFPSGAKGIQSVHVDVKK
jgi:DMSO/TMAO reductase YedYZ molybdopterin-dependent catalytic subunit